MPAAMQMEQDPADFLGQDLPTCQFLMFSLDFGYGTLR